MKELLLKLRENNIHVSASNGGLRIQFNGAKLPAEFVEEIKANKEELLAYLKGHVYNKAVSVIPAAPFSDAGYPLSSAQLRLWVLSQLPEGNRAYNMSGMYVFEGAVDPSSLEAALQFLVARHEILRTVFREGSNGEVHQFIQTPEQTGFRMVHGDLQGQSNAEQQAIAMIEEQQQKEFDLSRGPLLRSCLYRVAEERWLFSYTLHHIISDGWSMSIFLQELLKSYSSYRQGAVPVYEPLKIQYKDYASWQQEQVRSGTMQGHRNYWLQQFAGEIPVLELAGYRGRPAVKSYRGGIVRFELPADLKEALHQLVQQQGATLFMALLAAVKALLHRYTQQEDIVVGSPIAGREHADLEDQIGFYVNTLALRTQFSGNDSYEQLLQKTKAVTMGGYEHQSYPFDELVQELKLHRDVSRSPLFDVMVVLQNAGMGHAGRSAVPGEVKIKDYQADQLVSKFDLVFNFFEAGQILKGTIEYNRDIYDEAMVEMLSNHLHLLLKSCIENPHKAIGELELLTEQEQKQLLTTFNDTEKDYASDSTIVSLFEEQARLHADRGAVVFEGTVLSYGELNGLSNQLAGYLRNNYHIEKDTRVAIRLRRSQWMIVSILGVLKAGGAYVPVDADYPAERIEFMLKDSGCAAVIDETELQKFFNEQDSYSSKNIDASIEPHHLAYVIYTSGSTGQPKGVMIEHHNLCNRVQYYTNMYQLTCHDRFLFYRSYSFDGAIEEYFLPVLVGGCCYITPEHFTRELIHNLFEAVEAHEITKICMPPAVLSEFVLYADEHNVKKLSSLRHLVSGADKLTMKVVNECLSKLPVPMYNTYGPTENTIDSTNWVAQPLPESTLVPIGRPIENTQAYVLNDKLGLMPVGVYGELYLGGGGLARGYLNNETLTRERFISHPFRKNERLYRTGDVVRWLPDGNIEFSGRRDEQVKLRGFRIELGEIEHALQQYEGIHAAVVAAKAVGTEKELVAYIVSESAKDASLLRAYLQTKLPAYMMPAYFVWIDELPLNQNGKIDRKKLPAVQEEERIDASRYAAPQNETEEKLVKIWQDILGKETIGTNDNFFELGGHSLKAARMIMRVKKELKTELDLLHVFTEPTIKALAEKISKLDQADHSPIPAAIATGDGYPLSSAQHRLWVLSQLPEGNRAYNMSGMYVFEGTVDPLSLEAALKFLITRHESLRTVFREGNNGEVRQFIQTPEETGFRMMHGDLQGQSNAERQAIAMIEDQQQKEFELSSGPLVRSCLYRVSEERWLFSYTLHHITSDGWSMGIFLQELMESYSSYRRGTEPDFEPLKIQYKDYASWQQEQLRSGTIEIHRNYWLQQFAGEIPVLELAGYLGRPAVKSYRGGIVRFELPADLKEALHQLVQQQGATLFMGLLAAVKALLHRYTQQEDIVVGSPIAGREHADLEDQIGFYANTLALRTQFSGSDSYEQLLQKIKAVTLGGYEHQSYPFDELVQELKLHRDVSRSPLFDVMVLLQNAGKNITPGEVKIRDYPADQSVSKFDLLFSFYEVGQGLRGSIEYNSDIYDEAMVEMLSNHLHLLLKSCVANPHKAIGEMELLTEQEREQLLTTFNDTAKDYASDSTIVSLFEEQARLHAETEAVVFEGTVLSYEELNGLSNQLAGYLSNHYPIEKDTRVAIRLRRSQWMIVSILGVLKAGGAYVPVDADYPAERIEFMLKDSGCAAVIDEAELQKFFVEQDNYSSENIVASIEPHHLAYVIYTSGSTGQPKGVMMPHRAMVNLMDFHKTQFATAGIRCVLQFASVSFDVSFQEIFSTLLMGATLFPIEENTKKDIFLLTDFITENRLDTLFLPTAYFKILMEEQYFLTQIAGTTNYIIVAGEQLLLGSAVIKALNNGNFELHNHYGPAETHVVTAMSIGAQYPASVKPIPSIGKPVQNTAIYILNAHQRLMLPGAIGEIYIGGHAVSRGYLDRAELTEERFIRNPYRPGEKMYRTGDIGKWERDGTLTYLGRKDLQVKIKGYRIELGEVEAVLKQQPLVRSAVVLARDVANGLKELYAYVTCDEEGMEMKLRTFLSGKMPGYMIPSHFIQLAQLPLTANGKIDRKKLLELEDVAEQGDNYVAPQTENEKLLVAVFEKVLKRQPIGVQEDFFALGGDSIKSIQVVSALKQKGYTLSIGDILNLPQICNLANCLKKTERAIDQAPVEGIFKLSPIQTAFFRQRSTDLHHYNQSVLLSSGTTVSADGIKNALRQLIIHHDALRMTFHPHSGEWVQKNEGIDQQLHFEVLHCSDEEDFISSCERIQSGADLEKGPLFRAALFPAYAGKDYLLLVAHHLIIDGVSWRILFEDLSALYGQYVSGQRFKLPLKTDSFKYWMDCQLQYGNTPLMEDEASYWQAIEKEATSFIPLDFPNGSNFIKDTVRHFFVLQQEKAHKLTTQCYSAYRAEANDILLTALGLAVYEVFGVAAIAINLEGHGRERIGEDVDITRTVGWFTSMFPVLVKIDPSYSLVRQLIEVKEHLHRVPNKGIGYGIARYLLNRDYKLHLPLSFNYLGDFGTGVAGSDGGQLFNFESANKGHDVSPDMERVFPLEVSGIMVEGKMYITVEYSRNQFREDTVQRLISVYEGHLLALIETLSQEKNEYLTPVDLTYKGFDADFLQELNHDLGIEDIYPVSGMQEIVIREYEKDTAGNGIYHPLSSWIFEDEGFSIAALQKAIDTAVQKHPALRTVFFTSKEGRVFQCLRKSINCALNITDLSALPENEQRQFAASYVQADISRKFSIGSLNEPLVRFALFRLSDNRFELVFSCHHAIIDGWGFAHLRNELMEYYLTFRNGNTIRPRTLANVFKEHILSEDAAQSAEAVKFWTGQLKDYRPETLRRNTSADGNSSYATLLEKLNKSAVIRLKEIAARQKVSLRSVYLAAFIEAMQSFFELHDLCVGVVFNGRSAELSDALGSVGLFWNILPFRLQAASPLTIKDVHDKLNLCGEFSRFSALRIREMYGSDAAFISFNFTHFHNSRDWQAQQSVQGAPVQLDGGVSIDRYHYPLNVHISINAHDENRVMIKYDYDQQYFSEDDIKDFSAMFISYCNRQDGPVAIPDVAAHEVELK